VRGCSGVISSGKRSIGTAGALTFEYNYSTRSLIVRSSTSTLFNQVLDPATRSG
jgi:hypothetical protein